jgi:hypothetical protein
LRGDAAELRVLDLLFDVIADFDAFDFVDRVHHADLPVRRFHHDVIGNDFHAAESLVAAVLLVDRNAHQHVLIVVALLGGRCEGCLDGIEDDFARHALLVGDRIHDQQKFLAHLV